ncbi:MAG: hypothetical protein P8012_07960 [Desulfobacterales bacterium]
MEEKYKIHAFYILLIMFLIIIFLFTIESAATPGLANYVIFSLTLISIALAILAIVYTMYANSAMSQNISSIESPSKGLSVSSAALSESTKNLSKKADDLPAIIKLISEKVEETHTMVSMLSAKTGDIITEKLEERKEFDEDMINRFPSRSSLGGILIIYTCLQALKTKKPFLLKNITDKTPYLSYEYAFGFLEAMRSFGIISYKSDKDLFSVESINELIVKKLSEEMDRKIEAVAEDDEGFKQNIKKEIGLIEAYFQE